MNTQVYCECQTEEELKSKKDRAMKCKVIALDSMDKHPLMNPTYFGKRDKAKLFNLMNEWFSKSDAEINEAFNDIVNDRLLSQEAEVQSYPVYNLDKNARDVDEPII